jgi:uncharacterized membrane protein YccC
LRSIGIIVGCVAALAGTFMLGSTTGDDSEGARVVRLTRTLNATTTSALTANQDADAARAHADDLETTLNGTQAELDEANGKLDETNAKLNEARTMLVSLRAQQKRETQAKERAEAADELAPADVQQAEDWALAIATRCSRVAEGKIPSHAEMEAAVEAIFGLPELLKRDPDTYYTFPDERRQTMRQLVGVARDQMANGSADPCNEYGASKFNTVLETLPR